LVREPFSPAPLPFTTESTRKEKRLATLGDSTISSFPIVSRTLTAISQCFSRCGVYLFVRATYGEVDIVEFLFDDDAITQACILPPSLMEQQLRGTMSTQDQRIAQMTFASIYPMYLTKVERKGRTKKELHQVIEWLTGFDYKTLQALIRANVTLEAFFRQASLNPNAHLITGVICGYRVEEIRNPLTQQVRYLDKLVDELAKGRKMEKILRGS
jgi:hypothetical protein